MSRPPNKPLPSMDLLNFLLNCSSDVLRNYELMPTLPPGAKELAAALRGYAKRAQAPSGKCHCGEPCDRNSVLYCPFHMAEARERMFAKSKKTPHDRRDNTVACAESAIFLLNCSGRALRRFELARINRAAGLRNEIQGILHDQIDAPFLRNKLYDALDKLVDEMAQLGVARWFRAVDREAINRAIEVEKDPVLRAKKEIREQGLTRLGRIYFPSLNPGEAHRFASMAYAERNMAAGKCSICPLPLDRVSVRYCTKHLAAVRERAREKSRRLNKPPHNSSPSQIKALKEANEKRKRGKP